MSSSTAARSRSRRASGSRPRWPVALAALALTLGGCTLRSGDTEPGSVPHGNRISIDLRHKPTRQDLGFPAGRNFRSYQRAGTTEIATTVLLPTGTLNTSAFSVNAASDSAGGAGDTPAHNPKDIDILRVFPDATAAARGLSSDATVLGLNHADIDRLMPRIAQNHGSRTFARGVLDGLVLNWLAVDVDLNTDEDGTVQADYHFTVDQYHNEAIDTVVHDGVFPIDLTRRPSRADLAFLDTYWLARVQPAPGAALTVRLTLPGGVIERRVNSVDSTTTADGGSDPQGVGQPRSTIVWLTSGTAQDARRTLDADAAVLGLQPSAVDALLAGGTGTVATTLAGRETPIYDVTVTVNADLGQPGAFAATLRYTFRYHPGQ